MNIELAAIVGEEGGKWMHLLVSNGTNVVHKKRKLSLTSDRMSALTLIRQAQCDLAGLQHGDKWREHVTPRFYAPPSPEELSLVKQALELIDQTFEEADEDRRGKRDESDLDDEGDRGGRMLSD